MAEEKESTRWLQVFENFIRLLRIDSKEVAATDERGSPLNLWRSQRRFLETVCKGLDKGIRRFYCLKSRQVGLTTLSLVFDVFWLAFYPGTIGALVTDTPKNSAANRRVIRRYIESVPKVFFGKSFTIVDDNRDFLTFSNGSRLDLLVAGTRTKKTWGEGVGYVFAHLTEVASYGSKEGIDSFMEALAEQHPNRLLIIEGTAKGFNHWRDMWIDAKKDVYTTMCVFIGWWSKDLNIIKKNDKRYLIYNADPDHDEQELIDAVEEQYNYKITSEQLAWYRWRTSADSTDIRTMYQNQPWTEGQAFVMTGFSFFAVRTLQKEWAQIKDQENPVTYHGYKYVLGNDFHSGVMEPITDPAHRDEVELRVWEDPIETAQYAIGVDPAWGRNDHKDRHCVSVWRCFADHLVQVAEYADNNTENRQCAWVLAHLAGSYRNSMVNIELTGGPGRAIMTELDHLRQRMQSEMYRDQAKQDYEWDDFLRNARWYLYHKCDSAGGGYPKGWETHGGNKWEIMLQMKDAHNTGQLVIRSVPLIEEMLTVVQDGSEIGAPGKGKDDRVLGGALAIRAWIDWVRPGMIANGETLEVVLKREEEGVTERGSPFVDQIVRSFLKKQEDYEEPPSPREKWMTDRGFM